MRERLSHVLVDGAMFLVEDITLWAQQELRETLQGAEKGGKEQKDGCGCIGEGGGGVSKREYKFQVYHCYSSCLHVEVIEQSTCIYTLYVPRICAICGSLQLQSCILDTTVVPAHH